MTQRESKSILKFYSAKYTNLKVVRGVGEISVMIDRNLCARLSRENASICVWLDQLYRQCK